MVVETPLVTEVKTIGYGSRVSVIVKTQGESTHSIVYNIKT